MSAVAFEHFAIVILKRDFPPMKSRRELLAFMGGDTHANLLWTEYLNWHCRLNPANRKETFRAWLKELPRDRCTTSCFAAFMRRTGWNVAASHGMTEKSFDYKRGAPEGFYMVRAVANGWTLEILDKK